MRHIPACSIVILLIALMFPPWVSAQVPEKINYQGRLVDEVGLVNGNHAMTLRLFDAGTLGTEIYAETQSVVVIDGLYTFCLGASNTVGTLSTALTNTGVWLEMVIDGTPLVPREELKAVAFALQAASVTNGAISMAMIADGATLTELLASHLPRRVAKADGE